MAGSTLSVHGEDQGEEDAPFTCAEFLELWNMVQEFRRRLNERLPRGGDGVRHQQYPVSHEVQQRRHARGHDVVARGRVTTTKEVQQGGHARGHGVATARVSWFCHGICPCERISYGDIAT